MQLYYVYSDNKIELSYHVCLYVLLQLYLLTLLDLNILIIYKYTFWTIKIPQVSWIYRNIPLSTFGTEYYSLNKIVNPSKVDWQVVVKTTVDWPVAFTTNTGFRTYKQCVVVSHVQPERDKLCKHDIYLLDENVDFSRSNVLPRKK